MEFEAEEPERVGERETLERPSREVTGSRVRPGEPLGRVGREEADGDGDMMFRFFYSVE